MAEEELAKADPATRKAYEDSIALIREGFRRTLNPEEQSAFDQMKAVPTLLPEGVLGVRFVPSSAQQEAMGRHYLNSSVDISFTSNMEGARVAFQRRDSPYPFEIKTQLGVLSGQISEEGVRNYNSSGLGESVSPLDLVAGAGLAKSAAGLLAQQARFAAVGAVGGAGIGVAREIAMAADTLYGDKAPYDLKGAAGRVAGMATFGAFAVPLFVRSPQALQTGLYVAGAGLTGYSAGQEVKEGNYFTAAFDTAVGVAALAAGVPGASKPAGSQAVSTLTSPKNSTTANGALTKLVASEVEAELAMPYLRRLIEAGQLKELPPGLVERIAPERAAELSSLIQKSASNRSFMSRLYDWAFPAAKELPQKHLEGPVAPELPRFQQLPDPQKDPIGYLAALQDDPQALARFFSSAEGGTLYFSDYHGGSHTAGTIEALSSFRGKLKDIVIGGDLLDARANRGKTPAELAREIITILDRIHEATGVPKRDIKVPLGNHDGPTIKVHREGMTNADRVISQEVGEEMGTLIREAGYTMITTSPEQSAFVAPDVVFSHVPNQTGPRRAAMETYARDDLPSGINDPTLPTSARVLPPGVRYQIHGDTHHGNVIFGVNYHDNELFVNVGLPAAGGVLANNSFPGVVVLSAPHRGGIRVPVALEFTPGAGGATGTYAPRGLPTRFTRELPPGLDEALGIVPRLQLPPIERAP